jgi:hypothetical protein
MLAILAGCSSLSTEVFDKIHEGDSAEKVKTLFGNPDSFVTSETVPGAQAWRFTRKADTCTLTIQSDVVVARSCEKNPNYANPAARFMQGFSKGYNESLRNSRSNNLNCTTSSDPYGNATTVCH